MDCREVRRVRLSRAEHAGGRTPRQQALPTPVSRKTPTTSNTICTTNTCLKNKSFEGSPISQLTRARLCLFRSDALPPLPRAGTCGTLVLIFRLVKRYVLLFRSDDTTRNTKIYQNMQNNRKPHSGFAWEVPAPRARANGTSVLPPKSLGGRRGNVRCAHTKPLPRAKSPTYLHPLLSLS